MSKKIRTEAVDHLFEAILCLKDKEECYTFFEDVILTKEEREEKEKSGKPADYIIHDLLELKKIL